jgi:hypothetical protein
MIKKTRLSIVTGLLSFFMMSLMPAFNVGRVIAGDRFYNGRTVRDRTGKQLCCGVRMIVIG